jgi:predicted amidohydrolase
VPVTGDAVVTRIAAAQCASVAGDIEVNVQRHLRFMAAAAEQGVRFLVFPELSLTGYEPTLAPELAISPLDARLKPISDRARELNMMTVVGAPIKGSDSADIFIAALTFGAADPVNVYTKRHLHAGEERVFRAGKGGDQLETVAGRISLAVCADFGQASHPLHAANLRASVYAVSALVSVSGYANDSALLASYARDHRMAVLLANHGAATGGWEVAGRSALWSENGTCIAQIPGDGNALLVATRGNAGWTANVLAVRG